MFMFWPSIGTLEVLEWRLTGPGSPEAERLQAHVMDALSQNMDLVYGVDFGPNEGPTFFSQTARWLDRPSGLAVTHLGLEEEPPSSDDPPAAPEHAERARLYAALTVLERAWCHEFRPYPKDIALRQAGERREGQLRALFDSFTATHPGLIATIRRG